MRRRTAASFERVRTQGGTVGPLEVRGVGVTPDLASGAHGIERARHKLSGARAVRGVSRFRLEQLGVRQDDAELIVQPVEEHP